MKTITRKIRNGQATETIRTTCDHCGRDFAEMGKTHIGDIKMGSLKINYVSLERDVHSINSVEVNGEYKMDDLCGLCLKELMDEILVHREYLRTFHSLKKSVHGRG